MISSVELKIKIMDKIKEIETRLRIGYTMSVYGNNAEIHDQMTNDIKTLLEAINYTRCCKSDSEQLCEHPMSERADIVNSSRTYCLKCSTTF